MIHLCIFYSCRRNENQKNAIYQRKTANEIELDSKKQKLTQITQQINFLISLHHPKLKNK